MKKMSFYLSSGNVSGFEVMLHSANTVYSSMLECHPKKCKMFS